MLNLSGNATEDAYSNLLSAIIFHNRNFNPGNPASFPRTVNISIFDGKFWSNSIQFHVDFVPVNDPPSMQITGTVDVTQYSSSRNRQANNTYEEDNLPVALIENLTIYDVDSNNGSWLKVVLNRALDGQAEKLAFNETLANKSGLIIQSQTWPDNTTLELVFSGNAPFYMYRELIRTFNYANTKNENPITGQRFVTFILADDQGAVSGPIIIRITVLERNDEPDVDLGGGAGVIDTVTFNDGDNVGVELVSHPHRLRIMLPDSAAISKITVELRATNGFIFDETEYIYPVRLFPDTVQFELGPAAKSITLLGNAPLEDYIRAVQALRYTNLENEPTTFLIINGSQVDINRTIIITVTDSGLRGLPPASTVAQVLLEIKMVNDNPPTLSLNILPECIANAEPMLHIQKRSVAETSHISNCTEKAPTVSSVELQGYNGTYIRATSRLVIQFSRNTNAPPIAKCEHLDQVLTLSPLNLALARKLAIWENTARLVIIFQENVAIPEKKQVQLDFHDSSGQVGVNEKCKHHVCLPDGLSKSVSGSYIAEPFLPRPLQL
ncbi:uncharacterized protein LOC134184578 [Corticium candelabrum]|uniref:uncharacterized protein LOC134184578 n=1 Tax=Corticium candelabrum TaxID=121492 RepID=UPI002E30711F|nr:uncharacterized protein LOC134184578 [Corticium candelabrum]